MSGIVTGCTSIRQWFLEVSNVNVDGTFTAVNNFNTDALQVSHEGVWQLQTALSGTDGDCTITIEQSADGTNWDSIVNGVNVVVPSNDSVTLEGLFFSGRFMRVVFGTGSTTGTVSMILTQK